MDLNKAIKNRHSVKKFKEKKPDWRDIIECIDAARYAPMAGSNYSLKFILVSDKSTIEKLADASSQPFVGKAHYVVVVCSNPSRTTNAYGERGKIYARQQAGAAIQNFLLRVEETGLATSWVGHFVDSQVKRILDIPDMNDFTVEALFPIGKETKAVTESGERLKPDLENILYFDTWGNKYMEPKTRVDENA